MPNDAFKLIADNPEIYSALKDLLRRQFKLEGSVNTQLDNDAIGQVVRARLDGLQLLEGAFREIDSHRTIIEKAEEPMKGR